MTGSIKNLINDNNLSISKKFEISCVIKINYKNIHLKNCY